MYQIFFSFWIISVTFLLHCAFHTGWEMPQSSVVSFSAHCHWLSPKEAMWCALKAQCPTPVEFGLSKGTGIEEVCQSQQQNNAHSSQMPRFALCSQDCRTPPPATPYRAIIHSKRGLSLWFRENTTENTGIHMGYGLSQNALGRKKKKQLGRTTCLSQSIFLMALCCMWDGLYAVAVLSL